MNWLGKTDTYNLLVDANYILEEVVTKYPPPRIEGFIKVLIDHVAELKPKTLAVFWDDASILDKQKLYNFYKVVKPVVKNFEGKSYLQELLQEIGICQLQYPGKEAEQLIASVCNSLNDCVILSDDKDYFQLLERNKFLKGQNRGICNEVTILEKYGLKKVSLFADYISLIGDKVDNIPKIVSERDAKELLNEKDSLEAWFLVDLPDYSNINPLVKGSLVKNRYQVGINYELVNLKNERFDKKYIKQVKSTNVYQELLKEDLKKNSYESLKGLMPKGLL